jgi:quinol monooxygenase YgiN
MPYSMAILKVADFSKWKENFDSEASKNARQQASEKSYMILHTVEDHNRFVLLNEWKDEKKVAEFFQSDKLKELQKDSGVIEKPEMFVFGKVEQGSV